MVGTNLGVIFPPESDLNDLPNILSPHAGRPSERIFSDNIAASEKEVRVYIH